MRFLFERETNDEAPNGKRKPVKTSYEKDYTDEKNNFYRLNNDQQIKAIEKDLKANLKAKMNIPNLAAWLAEGDDRSDNLYYKELPLYQVLMKLPAKEIGEHTESTIIALTHPNNPNRELLVNSNFIESADLFQAGDGADANTAFMIKALAFAFMNKIDLNKFRDKNHNWLSINKFKEVVVNQLAQHVNNETMSNYSYLQSKRALNFYIDQTQSDSLKKMHIIRWLTEVVLPNANLTRGIANIGVIMKDLLQYLMGAGGEATSYVLVNLIMKYFNEKYDPQFDSPEAVYSDLLNKLYERFKHSSNSDEQTALLPFFQKLNLVKLDPEKVQSYKYSKNDK